MNYPGFNCLPVYKTVTNFFQARLNRLAAMSINRLINLQVDEIIDNPAKKTQITRYLIKIILFVLNASKNLFYTYVLPFINTHITP